LEDIDILEKHTLRRDYERHCHGSTKVHIIDRRKEPFIKVRMSSIGMIISSKERSNIYNNKDKEVTIGIKFGILWIVSYIVPIFMGVDSIV
jgi:hypothetical protein